MTVFSRFGASCSQLTEHIIVLTFEDGHAGLGSHYAHMWAIYDFVPVQSIGDPRDGRG